MAAIACWAPACSALLDDGDFVGGGDDASVDAGVVVEGAVDGRPASQTAVVAEGQLTPHWIAIDGNAVYWVNEGPPANDGGMRTGAIMKLERKAGAAPQAIATGLGAMDLAQDQTTLFWIEGMGGCVAGTGIGRVDKTGFGRGGVSGSCYRDRAVRIDSTHVYTLGSNGALGVAPKVPGPRQEGGGDSSAFALGLSSDRIYFSSANSQSILQADKVSPMSTQRLFAALQNTAAAIETDANDVYWIATPANTASRLSRSTPGATPTVLAGSLPSPIALALDTTSLWITTQDDGAVRRIAKSGGGAQVVGTGFAAPCGIAADDTEVYVADCVRGTITRLGRP